MPDLRLSVLGTLEIEYTWQPLVELTSIKAQALLVHLAVTARPHPRQALAGLLWTDVMERSARTSLRTALSQLRKSVDDMVLADRHSVSMNPERSYEIDVHLFEEACRRIQAGELTDLVTLRVLRERVDLYRGVFLADFPETDAALFEEWMLHQREDYRRLAVTARQGLADAALACNRPEDGIEDARRALALDPLHEPAHRSLMALYAASGQRSAALRQYEACVQLFAEELGASPSDETAALHADLQRHDYSTGEDVSAGLVTTAPLGPIRQAAPRHNLKAQTTPFVGREQELADLDHLLTTPHIRLLTVAGPGGIGKSRLAQEMAASLLPSYPQGVYFVELAPLVDAVDIPVAVADALSISVQAESQPTDQQILTYLAERQILLILDNFEHLLDGTDFVHAILQTAPMVKVLVTSRQRLHLSGETVFELGGMRLPDGDAPADGTASDSDALNLFVQCAQRARPAFDLDAKNVTHVARICRLVHGMPLAILLAAAWIEMLTPQEIADEVSRSLDFLTAELRDMPERQRSIRAVFASSWQQLGIEEQAVFMRLAVFRGGLTRAAAQTIAQASLPILSRLVSGSLLLRDGARQGRYQVHELLRQYAEEQLRAADQWDNTRDAHCAYFVDFLQALNLDLKGSRQLGALQEIEADWENVRAAWQWAVQSRDYGMVGRALDTVYWFCIMRSRLPAGQEVLRLAQEQLAPVSGEDPHPVWGQLMARAMKINIRYLEPVDEVKARVMTALVIAKKRNDRQEIAFCQWALGMAFVSIEDAAQALPYFAKSLDHYRAIGDRFCEAWLLYYVGLSRAKAHLPDNGDLAQSLDIRRSLGDRIGVAYSLHEIGTALLLDSKYSAGEPYLAEAYTIQQEMGNRQGMCENLPGLTAFTLAAGDLKRTATLAYEMREIADDMNSDRHKGIAEIRLGQVAFMKDDLVQSRRHFERALSIVSGHDYSVMSAGEFGLSQVASTQNDFQSAKQHLRRALEYGHQSYTLFRPGYYLVQAALLLAQVGQLDWATSLLALASTYGAIMDRRDAGLRFDLEAMLPAADFAAAWERGQTLQWEEARDELLAQLAE